MSGKIRSYNPCKIPMKKFSFSKFAGSKHSTLLKRNFNRKFQNTNFLEHISVAAFVVYFVLVLLTKRSFKCFPQFKFFVGLLENLKTFEVKIL